jgi:nucleotide-binding universal stress UspA family protein
MQYYGDRAFEAQMTAAIHSVTHPTDFSELSMNAFVHALRISVAAKAKLYILHVGERNDAKSWDSFPHVRTTLALWGLFDEKESPAQLGPKLGVEVVKVEIEPQDPVRGLSHFLAWHESDLTVLATHGREGLPRWFKPSIAEAMSRRVTTQNLFISPQSSSFVDRAHGTVRLKRILIPVDAQPAAAPVLRAVQDFCRLLTGDTPEFQAVHIGTTPLEVTELSAPGSLLPIETRSGNVVDGILQAAADFGADLIAMATAGHHGLRDAIFGSTTEQVLRHATCPVLAIPAVRARLERPMSS